MFFIRLEDFLGHLHLMKITAKLITTILTVL